MSSLADIIPEITAYQRAQQLGQQQQTQSLGNLGALQGILAKAREQGMLSGFRDEMAAAKTDEEKAAVAVKYGTPQTTLQHFDRQTSLANTKEIAIQRLTQGARDAAARLAIADRNATTAEQKAEVARGRADIQNWYQRGVLALQQGKAAYELPPEFVPQAQPAPSTAPTGALSAPPAPTPTGALSAPAYAPQVASEDVARTTAPTEAAALAQFASGGGGPRTVSVQPEAAPNNFDARDLRLQGGGALQQVAANAAPVERGESVSGNYTVAPVTAQKGTTLADAPANLSPKDKAKWLLQQTKPSIAGNAPISPETATRLAQQALTGDMSGAAGWSRNQTAKAQIENEITRLAGEQDVTGGDIAGRKGMNAANKVALTAVTKDLAAITPFKEMLDTNANVAKELGRQIANDKTNSAFINKPLLWVKNNLGNRPEIAEYLAQMHFVEVEAARVLTQPRLVGQLTDQAIKDMKSVIDGSMTIASTERVIDRILADGNNRTNAMKNQQARLLADMKGTPPRTRDSDKPKADQFFR